MLDDLVRETTGVAAAIAAYLTTRRAAELYFDVVIERDFVDAFISNLTALVIVSILPLHAAHAVGGATSGWRATSSWQRSGAQHLRAAMFLRDRLQPHRHPAEDRA